ncbi:phospholipase D family protein [Massilia sp. IC2-476]|uniref:phospholipase D family protein n=1 Tax=Massilia sp. IC2-476 TaxID=2887199 RepID=UPI001D100186|nr:phospholipase D family protein [Massilia sp. IC2-476]MCC2971179.1 phospholipase D family protein [Massilia sp. IC2-476]
MKFVANVLNGCHLGDVLPGPEDDVDGVLAAIAYGSNSTNEKDDFIGNCIKHRLRLDLWMRYDHTVPVAVPLLERLLRHERDNIFCKFIPDRLHSKVIWWKGYGAYIGSANLTSSAWFTNIEAGIFFSEDDLQSNGMDVELDGFFDELRNLNVAIPLSPALITEMKAIEAKRGKTWDLGKDMRKTPVWEGPVFFEKRKAFDKRREEFKREWHATLTHLAQIGERLAQHRPNWITEDVPLGWQIDQFLHAYYYNHVGERNEKPYEDFFRRNYRNPRAAVDAALKWWKNTPSAPSKEDEMLYVNAPFIKRHLSRENLQRINEDELAGVCIRTHATRDHVIKMSLATLGKPGIKTMTRDERVPLYASWLLQQRNEKGWGVLELLDFVLYGGKDADTWERLYIAARDKQFQLPHYGLNTMAELVGWVRPDVAPPRNGRTSKALRALGYDVRVY